MYQALYRKWRPTVFDDVCGQEHITSVLKFQVANNKISHAYLFCGTRGTGKTSCAKILARAVNCENPKNGNPCGKCPSCLGIESGSEMDVIEMDAASNNGVDNIRDIRDDVMYMPANLKYRVYIVDEVHMLSSGAFNALLKTLEEPPEHVIFILATTELHKLPATIISRCQRFDFRKLSVSVITDRLRVIAESEKISADDEGLALIARIAEGGMRDAISLFELCAGGNAAIDAARVTEVLGLVGRDRLAHLVTAVSEKDYDGIFSCIADVENSARDIAAFWQSLISYYRDLLVVKTAANAAQYLQISAAEKDMLTAVAGRFTVTSLLAHCAILENTLYTIQRASSGKRSIAELALVRMSDNRLYDSDSSLPARVSELEAKLAAITAAPSAILQKREAEKPASAAAEAHEAKNDPPPVQQEKPENAKAPVSYLSDIVAYLGESAPSLKGFFNGSDAYIKTEAGKNTAVIKTGNTMLIKLLEEQSNRNAVIEAFNRASDGKADIISVTVEKTDGKEKESAMDELATQDNNSI